MIDYLRGRARVAARGNRTGWARYGDIQVAYYPMSRRFNLFVAPHGRVNRAWLERYIERLVSR